MRAGGTKSASRYQINFLATVRSASFAEVQKLKCQAQTVLPLLKDSTTFSEVPSTENTALASGGGALDIDAASLQLIGRVYSSKPKDFDAGTLARFRSRLHSYMAKFGTDDQAHPLKDPHGPTEWEVAHFLGIAPPRRLETLLDSLMLDRVKCYSYGWFTVVALSRIHGIHYRVTKKANALFALERKRKKAPPEPEQLNIDEEIRAIAAGKTFR